MRIVDLIEKKKKNGVHTKEEIDFLIDSYMNSLAADYQISAWLMAVYFNGLNIDETTYLTEALINSGEKIELSGIKGETLDKHSTGGVGDKVTLTLTPLLAACGIPIAKLSGRGLGHTGGTIDKLESIPGFCADLEVEDFISQVGKIGIAIGSQTKNLTPADGKLYALRDVTATIDSPGLITSSVISKKIAAGAQHIILDVKYGAGAFVKTPEDAVKLAEIMVETAKRLGKNVSAVITSMEEPLGRAVGNSIEIIESMQFLKGKLQGDLADLTMDLAKIILVQTKKSANETDAQKLITEKIESGKALNKFKELIKAQQGEADVVENYLKMPHAKFQTEVKSPKRGYIKKIDAYKIAFGCKFLGAGREKKIDKIDYAVGVYLNKKCGEFCDEGEVLYTIFSNDEKKAKKAQKICDKAFEFCEKPIKKPNLIYKVIQ